MEDVRSITLKMIDLMEQELKKFDKTMADENIDKINNVIWEELERICPNDYKHHH